MPASTVIFGCSGVRLTDDERALFTECKPWGLILFARNIESPEQVRSLVDDFLAAVGREQTMVFIDQEGGRVSRLPATHWRVPPSPTQFAALYRREPERALEAIRANYTLIAQDLKTLGINVNCVPMLDVIQADSAEIIASRALGDDPSMVCALARATIEGLRVCGVAPVIKHAPGHGRAITDSHLELPIVRSPPEQLEACDFATFFHFRNEAMLMTAHVVYEAIDPERAATVSPRVINEVIRGKIGFDGLIMSDDLSMSALTGSLAERARSSLDAGCDVALHCNGDYEEMRAIAGVVDELGGKRAARAGRAQAAAFAAPADVERSRLLEALEALE